MKPWRSVGRGAVAAAALALLATACSGTSTTSPGPSSATPASTSPARTGPAPVTLAQFDAQHLDWQPCSNGFQCARLLVPFDYAHPGNGKRFSLPVIKLPASDPDPKTRRGRPG